MKMSDLIRNKELVKQLDLFVKTLKESTEKEKKEKPPTRRKEQACKTCGKMFYTVGGYLRHRDIHICSTSKCRICFKRFDSKEDIQKHMSTHLQNKSFSCEKCNAEFAYRTSLQRHQRRCIDQSLCICSICGQTFVSKDNLADHMKGKHEKGDGYQCPECGMFFRWRSSLSKHNKKQHRKIPQTSSEAAATEPSFSGSVVSEPSLSYTRLFEAGLPSSSVSEPGFSGSVMSDPSLSHTQFSDPGSAMTEQNFSSPYNPYT